MIEVASGEYDTDMIKLAKAALRKYEKNSINRLAAIVDSATINRHDGECNLLANANY